MLAEGDHRATANFLLFVQGSVPLDLEKTVYGIFEHVQDLNAPESLLPYAQGAICVCASIAV